MARRGRRCCQKISSDNVYEETVDNANGKVAYSDELPEFFTLYTPAVNSKTMRIPPDFVEKFGGDIPPVCTLIELPPTRASSWLVDMNKINDGWFLQKGWPEFVQGNSLEDGDFLLFSYAANSTFYVKMFPRNGCIKRSENANMVDDDQPTQNLEETDETDQSENQVDNRAMERMPRSKSSMTRNSVNQNPSYLLRIKESYLSKGCQPIPRAFWRSYMREKYKKGSNEVTFWVQNNSWIVHLKFEKDRVTWGNGSSTFVRENSLQVGNSCTLELIDGDDLAFKVIIQR